MLKKNPTKISQKSIKLNPKLFYKFQLPNHISLIHILYFFLHLKFTTIQKTQTITSSPLKKHKKYSQSILYNTYTLLQNLLNKNISTYLYHYTQYFYKKKINLLSNQPYTTFHKLQHKTFLFIQTNTNKPHIQLHIQLPK